MAWYRKAADQGDITAQTNICEMYRNGWGVEQDVEKAVAWYRKAAARGEPMAQTNLGASYLLGQGVQKDLVQAYMWCALAASAGHDKGKECLAYTANLMNADKIAEARRRAREWSKSRRDAD